jgi:hypothetical protein
VPETGYELIQIKVQAENICDLSPSTMMKQRPAIRLRLKQALTRRVGLALAVIVVIMAVLHVANAHVAPVAAYGYETVVQGASGSGDPCEQGAPHEQSGTHCTVAASGHFCATIESSVDLMLRPSTAAIFDDAASYRGNNPFFLFRPPRLPHQA